jgi:hypothetical protein
MTYFFLEILAKRTSKKTVGMLLTYLTFLLVCDCDGIAWVYVARAFTCINKRVLQNLILQKKLWKAISDLFLFGEQSFV